MQPRSRLVLAIDETHRAGALDLVRKVRYMDAVKVGYPLVLSTGLDIVGELADITDVICDFKVADIPDVNRKIVGLAIDAGASAIITHAFPGSDSMKACIDVAHEHGKEAFVVVEMSHPGATEYLQFRTEAMVRAAVEAGADGLIAPGTRPERIRKVRAIAGGLTILSPGIGIQGGSARTAIEAGADFIIVGRSVCEAEDPEGEARQLVEEMGGQWG